MLFLLLPIHPSTFLVTADSCATPTRVQYRRNLVQLTCRALRNLRDFYIRSIRHVSIFLVFEDIPDVILHLFFTMLPNEFLSFQYSQKFYR